MGSKNAPSHPLPHTTNKIKINEIWTLNKNDEINLKGRRKHALLAAKVLHKTYYTSFPFYKSHDLT